MTIGKDTQELVEKFEKLIPANKANALSIMRATFAAQENTRKAMESARKASSEEKVHGKPAA